MAGRKRLLTPELQSHICNSLENGTSIKDACALAGIGERTFHEWVEIGCAYSMGEDHPRMPRLVKEREELAQFAQATTRARANMRESVSKSMLARARAGDMQAAAFLLERTDPENWGRQTRVKLDVSVTVIQEFNEAMRNLGKDPADILRKMTDRARNEQRVQ